MKFFREIGVAKVFLTRKPCGVAGELPYGGDTMAEEEKRSEGKTEVVLGRSASTDDLITTTRLLLKRR